MENKEVIEWLEAFKSTTTYRRAKQALNIAIRLIKEADNQEDSKNIGGE